MKFKSYIKFVLAVVLILFITSVVYIIEPAMRLEKTSVSYAAKRDLVQSIVVNGTVEAKAREDITVAGGQLIKKLYIEKSSIVNKGDTLFEIDDNSLEMNIKSKEIELKKAELELQTARTSNLEKDNAQNMLALEESELNIMKLRANIEEIKENLDVSRSMYEKGYLSKKDLEVEEYNYKKASAELKLMEKEFELDKEKNEEFALNYDKNKRNDEESLSNNIELIKLQLRELYNKAKETNTASIDGKVINLELKEGEKVNSNGPHISIYDLSELYIDMVVNQRYASYIKLGDIAEITMPGVEKNKLYGSVYSIDEIASPDTYSGRETGLKVKVQINNPDPVAKVGYKASVKLIFNSKENAVTVDYRAIVKDRDDNEFIYILKDGIANKTYVETGIKTDFDVEITKGVISRDQYIVNPSERMREKNSFRLWRYEIK
ncbi:hypothetical protein SDC9_86460 [bioreactor metagenome]|uniref:YknX-like C-terminal permuted SH3-like domain-containing protein n=1 Tax=bioreactor metagenome TaxID=1076179 RepID=A0A644ZQD9_9ZZZZ